MIIILWVFSGIKVDFGPNRSEVTGEEPSKGLDIRCVSCMFGWCSCMLLSTQRFKIIQLMALHISRKFIHAF